MIKKILLQLLLITSLSAKFEMQNNLVTISAIVDEMNSGKNIDENIQKLINLNDGEASLVVGNFYSSTNKDLAIKNYEKAIKEGSVHGYHNIATIYLEKDDKPTAIKYLNKSIENGVDDDILFLYLIDNDKKHIIEAMNKNIDTAFKFCSEVYKDKKYDECIMTAYKKKVDFVSLYRKTKDIKILKEGISSKDNDSIFEYVNSLDDITKGKSLIESIEKDSIQKNFILAKINIAENDYREAYGNISISKWLGGNTKEINDLNEQIIAKLGLMI